MPNQTQNRLVLIALAALFFLPLAAAWGLYYLFPVWQPQGRTHYGELIHPARAINNLLLQDLNNQSQALHDLRGRWSLVTWIAADCQQVCQRNLHNMRQIRLALTKNMTRVQRVAFLTNPTALQDPAYLQREYHGTYFLTSTNWQPLRNTFAWPATVADGVYLLDPLLNLILYYPSNADPNLILQDMRRLLKLSQIG